MWLYFLKQKQPEIPQGAKFSSPSADALCKGPVQSQRDLTLPQSRVEHRGVAGVALGTWAQHAGHGDMTDCWVSASWECPHELWAFFGSCCMPNQWVWNSQWGLQDGFVCIVTPSSPITITESPLNLPSFKSATERMIACVFLTKHPGVILTQQPDQRNIHGLSGPLWSPWLHREPCV